MTINEKYSYRDFSGQSLADVPVEELNGTEIVGSCFYQENQPDARIFPTNMKGVTFRRCNLDNVYIPNPLVGPNANVVITEGPDACCTKRIKCFPPPKHEKFKGAVDWEVDGTGKPVKPMNPKAFEDEGLSIKPVDIPADFIIEETLTVAEFNATTEADWKAVAAKGNKPLKEKHAWFKEVPEVISNDGKTVKVRGKAWLFRGEGS